MQHLHFVRDYQRLVWRLRLRYPKAKAMAIAVGSTPETFHQFGRIELAVLTQAGLRPGATVFDLGCGSGRLAAALAENGMAVDYLGTDVVPALLSHARSIAPAHFRFQLHRALSVPAPDRSVDIACAFSVFTHLLHAETYIYLADMRRALRPGGRIVFSFLEFAAEDHWRVFEETVAGQKIGRNPHLNQFIERSTIETWARRLGLTVERFIDHDEDTGAGPLGQSAVILGPEG